MIEAGFVDEVRALLAMGYDPDLPTLSAIGYGEIIAYIQGRLGLDEAVHELVASGEVLKALKPVLAGS